jgi:hypothetical protein
MKVNFIILTFIAFSLWDHAGAQTPSPNPVVDKNINKTVLLKPGDILDITGEKASLIIKGWEKDYAEIQITFSAEHSNIGVATREVEYMHYSLSRDKNTVELRNAFLLPSHLDRIESKVRVAMTLQVPHALALKVYNKYGDVELSDVSGTISMTIDFSDLMLNNVSGKLNIRSSYCEVRGQGLSLSTFTSIDQESKYRLSLNQGVYKFTSKFGDIDLTLGTIQSLLVDAVHTDVTLQPKDPSSFNYQLTNKDGKIYLPRQFGDIIKKENNQSRVLLTQKSGSPLLDIKTSFNTITIQ